MRSSVKQIRISPKKANLVAGIVRKMSVTKALDTLKYMPKKAASILYKLISSAAANAENNFGQKKEDLTIDQVLVSPGVTYKRGQSHSKGRVTPLLKRTSHLKVELKADIAEKAEKKAAPKKVEKKEEKKVEAKKTTKKVVKKTVKK